MGGLSRGGDQITQRGVPTKSLPPGAHQDDRDQVRQKPGGWSSLWSVSVPVPDNQALLSPTQGGSPCPEPAQLTWGTPACPLWCLLDPQGAPSRTCGTCHPGGHQASLELSAVTGQQCGPGPLGERGTGRRHLSRGGASRGVRGKGHSQRSPSHSGSAWPPNFTVETLTTLTTQLPRFAMRIK